MVKEKVNIDKKENKENKTINKDAQKKDTDFAKVYLKSVRISPKKLNIIISPIRGLNVEKALNYLSFSQRRISFTIKKALQSVIANAENNNQFDIDNLYIEEAYVGKSIVLKRFRARAKGRAAPILRKSFLLIFLIPVLLPVNRPTPLQSSLSSGIPQHYPGSLRGDAGVASGWAYSHWHTRKISWRNYRQPSCAQRAGSS